MIIFVATDLWGIKDNIRLEFNGRPPTLSHLTDRIEAAYQAEVIRLAPPDIDRRSIPRFTVECITLLVDDDKSVWVELFALKQLYSRCQLFAFQPANSFHSDSRGVLPPPREPIIGSHPSMPGEEFPPLALPLLDVAHITFHRLNKTPDQDGGNRIRTNELKAAMVLLGFNASSLPPEIAGRQYIDFANWLKFCHSYPGVAEALVRVGTVDPGAVQNHRSFGTASGATPMTVTTLVGPQTLNRHMSPNRHPTYASPTAAVNLINNNTIIGGGDYSARDLSPRRRPVSKSDQQRIAVERLSGGLSSRITARDRKPDVAYEAYTHQLTRTATATLSSPSNNKRHQTPTQTQQLQATSSPLARGAWR